MIENDLSPIDGSASAHDLLKRPFLKFSLLEDYLKLKKNIPTRLFKKLKFKRNMPVILKTEETVQELLKLESLSLDPEQDYNHPNLASELCQNLIKLSPLTLDKPQDFWS